MSRGDVAIIMASAKAMPSEQADGLDAGADEYITKPFDEVELTEVLRRYTEPSAGPGVASPGPDGQWGNNRLRRKYQLKRRLE